MGTWRPQTTYCDVRTSVVNNSTFLFWKLQGKLSLFYIKPNVFYFRKPIWFPMHGMRVALSCMHNMHIINETILLNIDHPKPAGFFLQKVYNLAPGGRKEIIRDSSDFNPSPYYELMSANTNNCKQW